MRNNLKLISAIIAIVAMVALATPAAQAQMSTSPYSRFGYGILSDNATATQSQMGGVGYAMNSGRQVNAMNPASYAMTDSLTFLFDMGVDFTSVWRKENAVSRNELGGGLDYITMQFPLGKRMGMSVGLVPYSTVGYSFGSEISNGSSSHEGVGGMSQLYVGVAGRVAKGLSVGANIGYLFGTTYNDVYALTSGSQSLFEQIIKVRDFHLDFGAQYSFNVNRDNRVTLGLTYSPSKSLLGHTWLQKYDVNTDAKPDTIGYSSLKGRYSIAQTWGAGIAWQWRGKLTAEADFTWQDWSKAKMEQSEEFVQNRLANRYKGALGLSYIPDSRGSYLKRVTYRLGGHYTRDYVMVGDNHVHEYGLACGFGLPAPASKTIINLGVEWLHRSTSPQSMVTENYLMVRLGVNFNQLWFMQSKLR